MSAFEDVYARLQSTGIPFAYMAFAEGSAPDLPWGVYYLDETDGFFSDDEVFGERNRWCVELYMRTLDNELVGRVSKALEGFSPVARSDAWVDSENCLEVVLRFTTITTKSQKE